MPKTLKWQKTVAFSDVWPKDMPQVPALDDFARETTPAAPPALPLALPIVTEGRAACGRYHTDRGARSRRESDGMRVCGEIRAPMHPQQSKMWLAGRSPPAQA